MREIIFRGKDKFDGEWYVGSLSHDTKYGNCFIEVSVHQGIAKEVIPETVGQYTGLTDKNGTKIFEGDILRLCGDGYDWNGIVVFGRTTSDEDNLEDYGYGWQLDKITKDEPVYTKILLWVEAEADGIDCEIIGNIHDNPELLNE